MIPGKESLIVIFAIAFESKGDQVLSKVFLQEFSEARRVVQGAPAVRFSERDPPKELTELDYDATDGNVSYVSFGIVGFFYDSFCKIVTYLVFRKIYIIW